MRLPYIWSLEEIQAQPEFGAEWGWFYGLVRVRRGRISFVEILPGLGYASPWPMWESKCWRWAFSDLFVRSSRPL